ncbi:MAG: alpha/beta fold hydrolase [Limnohabitans sp.]
MADLAEPHLRLLDLQAQAHTLASGVVLHAVRQGQGTPLVLVHGAMGDWRSWGAQWPALVPHADCVSYSRRYSHPNPNRMPSPDHSALQEAEDLLGLLDAMGIARALLVGTSYGAYTALAAAVAAPERVLGVVAVEPPMMKYAERDPQGQAIAAAFRRETIEPANAAFRAGDDVLGAQRMTGGIQGAPAPQADHPAMQQRLQNLLAMKMLALSSDEFPWLAPERLAALPMPVLLLRGERTAPVHRAIFEALRPQVPTWQTQVVPDSGHGVPREQPEIFNRLVLDLLRRIEG